MHQESGPRGHSRVRKCPRAFLPGREKSRLSYAFPQIVPLSRETIPVPLSFCGREIVITLQCSHMICRVAALVSISLTVLDDLVLRSKWISYAKTRTYLPGS
ncbi:hypothetical protein DAEQUDRAFT_381971 [Daedalea quercina L-15889]|uniref:Uncharacterized protein n=1 Tax=Daedalea quercina L-15889 TaxID=1314783 RepID=A0A165P006_9APHY|nr:hypothetical protein DAEQUDRAFT_381971 [Daedalea quercina L-15889]